MEYLLLYKEHILDILEFFLNILRTILHMFDVATDLIVSKSKNKKLEAIAIAIAILSGCIIYFLNLDTLSEASSLPLAMFAVTGIYLSYSITTFILSKFKEKDL